MVYDIGIDIKTYDGKYEMAASVGERCDQTIVLSHTCVLQYTGDEKTVGRWVCARVRVCVRHTSSISFSV